MSPIILIRDALMVMNVPGVGPAVVIPTTGAVEYAPGMSLQTALAAHQAQIVDSARQVARNTADTADLIVWAQTLGYVKRDHVMDGTSLNPLFERLEKVPTGTPETSEG